MSNVLAFIREPLPFKEGINIYPPSVRDVATNQHYGQFLKVLTTTQDDIRDALEKNLEPGANLPTPFEFLLINCYHNEQFRQITIQAFEFFTHSKVNLFYEQKTLVFGDLEEVVTQIESIEDLITIKEEEFFHFQNAIREACGDKPIKPPEPPNPNEDPRITAMKAKARERDRLKAKRNNSDGISIQTCLVAICCMGIGITPLNIGEMSYAAVGALMKMSQEKEKYDIDIRSLLAGADSKKIKPKYWIRNSDKE